MKNKVVGAVSRTVHPVLKDSFEPYKPDMNTLKDRFYEELISQIVLAGGISFKRKHLERMSVSELIDIIYTNYIVLHPENIRMEKKW